MEMGGLRMLTFETLIVGGGGGGTFLRFGLDLQLEI